MTFRSAIFESRVRISSWLPSVRYALALSSLRFSNGNTAMLFSGTKVAGLERSVIDPRRKKRKKLMAKARADRSKVRNSNDFGHRGALIGRTDPSVVCFHLLPRLSFSGRAELPRPSL